MSDTMKAFETARAAIKDGEERGLSARTMNRRWKAFFAAEDALKSQTGGW
jgi:hypothetical protein